MLPFLHKVKSAGGVTVVSKTAQTRPESEKREESSADPILACAEDLIQAVHARDARKAAEALRAAFQIQELEPHEEHESDTE